MQLWDDNMSELLYHIRVGKIFYNHDSKSRSKKRRDWENWCEKLKERKTKNLYIWKASGGM